MNDLMNTSLKTSWVIHDQIIYSNFLPLYNESC